jgi:hypothetical protein
MALLKLLKEAKPEDIAKILDAIVKAIPKLEPLINSNTLIAFRKLISP